MSKWIKLSMLAMLMLNWAIALAEPIESVGSFDIKRSLPPAHAVDHIVVQEFFANSSGLYFLIDVNPHHPPIAKTVILHTDSAGTRKDLIVLPPTGSGVLGAEKTQYLGIDVNRSGNVYVNQAKEVIPDNIQQGFAIYSPTKRHKKAGDFQHSFASYNPPERQANVTTLESISTFCFNNDELFFVDGAPILQPTKVAVKGLSMNLHSIVEWEAYGPLKIRPLTSSKLVILERIDSRIQIINLPSGNRKTISLLEIPEINQSIEAHHPDEIGRHTEATRQVARSVLVNDIATTNDGSIFLNVMGYHVSHGAVIVKLDQNGDYARSFRFKIPTFDELKTEHLPEGQMLSDSIAVSGTHLFIQGDGKVAKYSF